MKPKIKTLWTAPMGLPVMAHAGLVVASIVAFRLAKGWLDASYAAS